MRAMVAADGEPCIVIQEVRAGKVDWSEVVGDRVLRVPAELAVVVKALAPDTLVMLAKADGEVPMVAEGVFPVWGTVERIERWKSAILAG